MSQFIKSEEGSFITRVKNKKLDKNKLKEKIDLEKLRKEYQNALEKKAKF